MILSLTDSVADILQSSLNDSLTFVHIQLQVDLNT